MNELKKPGSLGGDQPKGLKKPGAAPAKALGASGGKELGAPAAAAPAPAAPPSSVSYQFDDAPAAPAAAPASAPPAAPAFDPFADQKVDVSAGMTAAAPASDAPAKKGTATHAKPGGAAKPGTGTHTKQPRAPAPIGDADEVDIRPGMAKDLWACPHCGCKNKPARETCRECGKSPSDEVVVQWYQKPGHLAAVGGGAVLLLALLTFMMRADVSLHPAGPGHIDSQVRVGGGGGGEQDLGDNHKFHGKGTIAVSGRILATIVHPVTPWVTMVSLALGAGVTKEEDFADWKAEFRDEDFAVTGAPKTVTLMLIFPEGTTKPTLTRGGYLSVAGAYGYAEDELGELVKFADRNDHPNTYVVKVKSAESE